VRILVPVTPFLVGEGVDGEVQERGGFEFVPAQLPRARYCSVRSIGAERSRGDTGQQRASCEHGNKLADPRIANADSPTAVPESPDARDSIPAVEGPMAHSSRRDFLKTGIAATMLGGLAGVPARAAKRTATDWVTLG